MSGDVETLLHRWGNVRRWCSAAQGGVDESLHRDTVQLIRAQQAEIERLREALETAWSFATRMRNASKLVGPYEHDWKATKIWQRALYHEGKELHRLLKPTRAALAGGSDNAER